MDSNISLLLEAGISSAMFDIDPGDEVNHPAQQFLNSADGSQSMSVDESPNFGPLGADNVLGSPPLLPLQDEVDAVEEGVLSDAEADSIARSVTGATASIATSVTGAAASAAAPLPQEPRSVKVSAVRAPKVAATAASATSDTTRRDISTRKRSDSEAMRKSTAMLREQWMSRYHELIEWKRKHGNCNVPQREKKLGCWVSTQRTQYKLLLEGRQSQMNQERIVSQEEWHARAVNVFLIYANPFPLCICLQNILPFFVTKFAYGHLFIGPFDKFGLRLGSKRDI